MVTATSRRGIIVHAAVVRLPLGTLEEIILLTLSGDGVDEEDGSRDESCRREESDPGALGKGDNDPKKCDR